MSEFFLVVHFLLGYNRLRDLDFYKEDPLVERVLGVKSLPDVSTVSRRLREVDEESITALRDLNGQSVLDRVVKERLNRLTLDFDGSVLSTKRKAERSAAGFNKMFKGRRSYYPLFCTLSQTGQFLDMHHRPGNVHDSNGAEEFVMAYVDKAKKKAPYASLETRMDGAFFQEPLVDTLNARGVEFTVSVPFCRYAELRAKVEQRVRWSHTKDFSYFELDWSPKSWAGDYRAVVVRTEQFKQKKGLFSWTCLNL